MAARRLPADERSGMMSELRQRTEDSKLLETRGDALLVVDVQRDFLPGGALAVPHGDAVIPALNRWLARAQRAGAPVFASRDWHPADHCSFTARGGPWPPHCIAGSAGAQLASELHLPHDLRIVDKATRSDRDAYSAFMDTGLADALRAAGVGRLAVGGLATDYCVLNSVRDALQQGFEVYVLEDAIRAVELSPGDGDRAKREMRLAGARFVAG
jgi:nicotinamidase/pyrazinamidase